MDQPTPDPPKSKRGPPLVLLGAAAALVAGGAIGWVLVSGDRGASSPPPASEGGLVIDSATSDGDGRMDPAKPLRCFVEGRFVGETTLADCARRNGVATDALDVGVDETGALAAADAAGEVLTPLPPPEDAEPIGTPESALPPDEAEDPAAAPASTCWRHQGGRWRRIPGEMALDACLQELFAGRCERPGATSYGRWGRQTLRLVAGRVEVSDDNQSFRTLANQGPGCALPPVG